MKNMANLTGGGLATAKSKQRNGYRKAIKILDLNLNLGRTSFAATCVALLLLLTTRDGECSIGDEILEADKPIPIEHVEGVLGSRGKLPCDVRVPTRTDKLHMVLWFRDKDAEPIYRYDVREKLLTDAKRSSVLGERLYFQTMSDPAHLSIQDLQAKDEGIYRCRVDFKNTPTRNLKINLTIIVPPETPVIVNDANGILASNNQVGPYNEGSPLRLTCEVSGGQPRPTLKWWLNEEMIGGAWVERNDGVIVNTLTHPNLQRKNLGSKFVCQASNTNLQPPKSASVIVNLNLRPLSVSILQRHSRLSTHTHYEIICESSGSRPPPNILWFLQGQELKGVTTEPDSDDLNITRSILSFTPAVEDDGKILTCRSENHWIPGSAIEDRWRLNVQYAPKVTLSLGANMVADEVKEFDDCYFECSVKSNPSTVKLAWYHNGRELRHNATQRVIMSNTRLVLQKISRHTAGNYQCSGQNSEGTTLSNSVLLRVKYVPTCKHNTESLVGAMKQETIQVICEMASDPPHVQFSWTFNNSGSEVIHVPQYHYTSSGTTSTLTYTPVTEMDYGTMMCWGSNSVGKGVAGPCYFQIVSAGRPFPPKNCSIFNKTEDSLSIACTEGFNGGLPQHFNLEVIDLVSKKIKLNSSYKMPLFSVDGMEPGVVFRFIIYSVNDKGRSEPFILDGITFRGYSKLTGPTADAAEINPLFAVLVGCTLVLVVVLSVAIIAVWKRSRRKPPIAKAYKRENGNGNGDANFETDDSALTKIENGLDEIGNPDVVPNKNGKDRGIRGFIRIHKTPPARRRKKLDLEVKNNGETVALTSLVETPDGVHRNHNHKSSLLTSSNHSSATPRESRI
ncbi:nephrin isoform X2 [Folsomia candida]|uniref:nephrin isoform X2 n=1 Tax=Folsomia candida TaxID=158441 RepID=UPI000B8F195B|nr:nephrin isoform X2 [Folsomia candida]